MECPPSFVIAVLSSEHMPKLLLVALEFFTLELDEIIDGQ